jgi:hypothetical protein
MVWRAHIAGLDVWLYRWSRARLHVAEVVAPVHLRSTLGLHDGIAYRLASRTSMSMLGGRSHGSTGHSPGQGVGTGTTREMLTNAGSSDSTGCYGSSRAKPPIARRARLSLDPDREPLH